MKNYSAGLARFLLATILICTTCLFAQCQISDDAPSDRTAKEAIYFTDMLPDAQINYNDIIQEPFFGFVSKVRAQIAQTVSLNIRLANYKACVQKWNHANRCKIQI